jgi:hypothetical protein
MLNVHTLLKTADAFQAACSDLSDKTLSYRVFGDTKKITALREGGDITVGRFNSAMKWFAVNWPKGVDVPEHLASYFDESGAAA